MKKFKVSYPVLGTEIVKPATSAGFCFSSNYSAKTVPMKYSDYKPPRIVKTEKRWYVEYYYRVPLELLDHYGNKKWIRFRVFEDINRYKTDEYAAHLLEQVEAALKKGHNPLEHVKEVQEEAKAAPAKLSLNVALDRFIEQAKDKGLRPKTIQNYGTIVNYLRDYFMENNRIYAPVESFTDEEIEKFLTDCKRANKWQNYTYNNYLGFTKAIFNWFVKKKMITASPVVGAETLPFDIKKNKYYDNATAEKLKAAMRKDDMLIYKFCMFVYYTGTRPKSETRFMKVKNIIFDRDLIFIGADISKNRKDDYIQLDPSLKEMLSEWMDYPPDYYLFGSGGKPAEAHAANNFFSIRFKPFKDKLRLSPDYTIYSFKHTRAIHLAEAGANPYEIMKMFRHYSLEMTIKYLRDLGCHISTEVTDKSRKF